MRIHLISWLLVALVSLPAGAAKLDEARPRGSYVYQPHLQVSAPPTPREGPSILIYMNRHGGTYYRSNSNDSRKNRSSIIRGTKLLPAFAYGDDSWNQVMTCVRDIYAPYNIEITDVDPGDKPHIESVVGGDPANAGFERQVGGVAPFSCGVIQNAIVFTFPELWGNDPRAICETAAQETAHAFGLDHEYYCPDPMTYLYGCGPKAFRDYDARCGEFSARACTCGGSTQNSHQILEAMFGARPNEPPTAQITSPKEGDIVQAGFVIDVAAADDVNLAVVELWIDGSYIRGDATPPIGFYAPTELAPGRHTIVARAKDSAEQIGDSMPVTVTLVPPCTVDEECADGESCAEGQCKTNLGKTCGADNACLSGRCVFDGVESRCSEACETGVSACPSGFDCRPAGTPGQGLCWPGADWNPDDPPEDGGTCGCRVGTGRSVPVFLAGLCLALVALVLFRRR